MHAPHRLLEYKGTEQRREARDEFVMLADRQCRFWMGFSAGRDAYTNVGRLHIASTTHDVDNLGTPLQ
jgi:hypothetical protein